MRRLKIKKKRDTQIRSTFTKQKMGGILASKATSMGLEPGESMKSVQGRLLPCEPTVSFSVLTTNQRLDPAIAQVRQAWPQHRKCSS